MIPNNRSTVSSIQTVDRLTTCDKDIANEFYPYFTSIVQNLQPNLMMMVLIIKDLM